MTASTDFDRFLASVLDAEGPQTIDQELVDTALATARAIPQRRPIVRGLDRRAWPRTVATRGLGRQVLIALAVVGALFVLALAAILAGTRPQRWELAADDRIVVMGRGQVTIVDPAGSAAFDVAGRYLNCVPVVRGTTVAAIYQAGGISLTDLATGRVVNRLDLDYAGFERWSAGGDRLAQIDMAGTVTLLDLSRPDEPTTLQVVDAPGVAGFDWSLDGRRAAFARLVDGDLVVEVIDVASGNRTVENRWPLGERVPDITQGEITVDLTWSSDGRTLTLLVIPSQSNGENTWAVTSIPLGGGQPRHVAMTDSPGRVRISNDGSSVAVPLIPSGITVSSADGAPDVDVRTDSAVGDLAWSPDGRWLVFYENGRLLKISPDDPAPVPMLSGSIHGFAWTPDAASLLVVTHDVDATVVLERYDMADQRSERLATLGSEADWRGSPCIRIEEGTP